MTTDTELRELFRRKADNMQMNPDIPDALTRRIKRKQLFQGGAAVVVVAAIGLGAWAVSGSFSSEPQIAPAERPGTDAREVESLQVGKESSQVDEYEELGFGLIDPGQYVYTGLSPDTVIRILPETNTNSGEFLMHLGLPSGGFLDIRNVTGVLSPDEEFPAPEALPEGIAAYLQAHPATETTAPKPAEVGGYEGFEMDIRATSFPHSCQTSVDGAARSPCLKLLYNEEYPVSVLRGEPTRAVFVEVEGRHVGFTLPIGGASEREARRMIASIRFLPSDLAD